MNQRRETLTRYRLACHAIDALRRAGYRRIGDQWLHPSRPPATILRTR